MKIKKCCEEIEYARYNNIGLSDGSDDIKDKGKPCYWTGEEINAHDVIIKYCPFCGTIIRFESKPKFKIKDKVVTDSGIEFEIKDIDFSFKDNTYYYYRNKKEDDTWAWDEENLKKIKVIKIEKDKYNSDNVLQDNLMNGERVYRCKECHKEYIEPMDAGKCCQKR